MRYKTASVLFLLLFFYCSPLFAQAINPSSYWDAFLDVGYRFTLLPEDDLREIITSEGQKYGQPLNQYVSLWDEMIKEDASAAKVEEVKESAFEEIEPFPAAFYRRLAVGHFLLYISNNDEKHLDRALKFIEGLAKRRTSPRTVFWHNLILAHRSLLEKDSASFSHNVYRIWNDVIQVVETDQLMLGSSIGTTGFNSSLPYLYENMIHLILNYGIVKHKVPNLHSLGTIIWALKDRLTPDKGYYQLSESIWNRMQGINSDRFSINFAMVFLEGEMHWINFEDAKSASQAAESFEQAHTYYKLALEWANTSKGKAAALSKLMQSMMRVLNGMVRGAETVSLISADEISALSSQYVTSARDLYRKLSVAATTREELWTDEGFDKRENYLNTAHELWSNISQLNVVMARYYRNLMDETDHPLNKFQYISNAEQPFSDYLSFFDEFTKAGYTEIVPDNAYFYAAYMAGELADLHRQKAVYSDDTREYDLAFARQVQAIEIFPFEIIGLIELSIQVSQEGMLKAYIDNIWPLMDRFRNSAILKAWATSADKKAYINEVVSLQKVIPEAFKSTPSVIGLQDTGKNEQALIRETLLLTQLLNNLLLSDLAGKADAVLEDVARNLKNEYDLSRMLKRTIRSDVFSHIEPAISLIDNYNYAQLKRVLFRDLQDGRHALFRSLYHEIPAAELRYVHLLDQIKVKQAALPREPFTTLRRMDDAAEKY
ncbi:MAG: hypothetical protein IME96_11950 [Proteobacteria bacterium]|nr:hypothetical protein [Pseudomonadota bacterium]